MNLRILLIVLSYCLMSTVSIASDEEFTLYLVRHAEKQANGSRDPFLTEAGQQRAKRLAAWLKDKGIEDIWSTGYDRTRDTGQPLVTKPGLELSIYDPSNQSVLVGHLLGRKNTALVVGHSNTIPELARLLCDCEIADMDDSEYDRLIVISNDGDQVRVKILNQRELP